MANLKKDGRHLNCFIQKSLLDDFEEISYMLGKTKTRLLEEAMAMIIGPYLNPETNRFEIKDGIFVDNNQEKTPCKVLYHCKINGQPYVAIYKDNLVMKVPEANVKD